MSKEVEHRTTTEGVERRSDLERFEQMVLDQLAKAGLPNQDVFVTVSERRRILGNVGDAIERLSPEQRAGSRYVSKMIAAAAAGLFDPALIYLRGRDCQGALSASRGVRPHFLLRHRGQDSDLRAPQDGR